MTPEEIAKLFPLLYHVTRPGSMETIERHGLLSTLAALERFGISAKETERLTRHRRPGSVPIVHPEHGKITINDNVPLSETALEKCLDDGLKPGDWLRLLNSRVFFWADEKGLERLLSAKAARGDAREVLVFGTERLAREHLATLAFSPINSGATIRKPARRGLSTFTRVADRSYDEWRRLRGRLDNVLEITVDWAVPRAAEFVVEVRSVTRS